MAISNILSQLPDNASFELATAAILHQIPSPISEPRNEVDARGTLWEMTRRLKLSVEEMTSIAWLVGHLDCWNEAPQLSDAQLKRVLAHPLSRDLRALVRAIRTVNCLSLSPIQYVDEYVSRHSPEQINPPELITGRDLIQLGLTPGPQFKSLIDAIRDAQLNGEIVTREEAIEKLRGILSSVAT